MLVVDSFGRRRSYHQLAVSGIRGRLGVKKTTRGAIGGGRGDIVRWKSWREFFTGAAYVLGFILSAGLETYPIVQVATMLTRALTFILRAVKGHQPIS